MDVGWFSESLLTPLLKVAALLRVHVTSFRAFNFEEGNNEKELAQVSSNSPVHAVTSQSAFQLLRHLLAPSVRSRDQAGRLRGHRSIWMP